ncbi:PREDICTED: probable disease resistance RPP8-like protein 2 [Ipomoea nil]|uniref:probable disease resistance RPP8-like protein 2 n=1 Tax=Ipomoea nil TaxID=35883 RepID=UPI0009019F28|nr:PREDICTED: probable disease resistance RPP8-like protein 2 [Ipomoea nil]
MAYVALTSLKTTIELHFLQPIPRVSFRDDQTPPIIKSLYENLSSLQPFLEKKSRAGGAAIKYFGILIRDFALKVEDDIEIQLSTFVVAKAKDDAVHEEAASQQLCQILQQAQEKTADVVEIINCGKEYKRLNDDLTYLKRIVDHHMKSIQSKATRVVYDQIQTQFKSLIHIRAPAAIKDLETQIGDLVEDEMKIHLSNFVLAKDTVGEEEVSPELCQTLKQAEEKRVELEERLKTYECCDDLTNLMTRINHYHFPLQLRRVFFDVNTTLRSLKKTLFDLQKFLQKSNFGAAEITDFVLKAKEDLERQFTNFCVANKEHPDDEKEASEALFQTSHQATENAAQLLSTIHNTTRNEANHAQSEFEFSRCYPKLEEGRMTGHQNEVSMIKNKLFSHFQGVKVIPIVGMLGIGKTTLAREILKDQSVALHFQVRGWVTVTQNYDEINVVRDLLQSISPNHEIETEVYLWREVCECLKEKRYLIVLDDIWSTQHWDRLQHLFCNSAVNGCCILLTTRFYPVADYACTIKGTHHAMSLLNPNESWDLFCTIFPLEKYRAPGFGKFRSHLSHVVGICEGLPLAIVVVAERLSKCNNNIQHELKRIEKEIELLGILDYNTLILMYNHLTENLKLCFLYLGVFPKRSEIQVKTLLRLWIAEGFVKPSMSNMELESIAYCYLQVLIRRSLVLTSNRTFDGKIKTCRVHSVMHNICFREAQKEGILCAVNTQRLPRWSLNAFANSCRWFSLCKHSFDYYVLFSLNNPRSIFFFQGNPEIYVPLKLLRVLAFVPPPFLQKLPMQLGDLIFLRYLSVTQWFEGLSDVVSSNANLQTLIVSCSNRHGSPILHLPSSIWEPPQLRHLELGTCYVVDPPVVVKENLRTLSWVTPTHCRNKVYFNFPNIKILKILYRVDLEASQISGSSSNRFILDNLALEYLKRLESLTITVPVGCIVTFPKRCIFPLQLKKLKLSGTNLSWWDLRVIGTLKWLEVLKLENVFNGKVWEVVEGGFYGLRFLLVKDEKLERLEAYTDSFPCLEHLVLRCCECLEEIPSSFGEIFCFKSIEMDRFSHRPSIVASARIIQEKLKKNFGKENFEIKIQGQGPEYIEDVEKANSKIKMEEGESSAGGGGKMVEEEIGVGKLKSYIHKFKKRRLRNLLKMRKPLKWLASPLRANQGNESNVEMGRTFGMRFGGLLKIEQGELLLLKNEQGEMLKLEQEQILGLRT